MIETRHLTKVYRDLKALDGLTLRIDAGDIYGFIGPNGAGKTTTIKILATLLRPTSGEAFVGGYALTEEPQRIRRLIGYVPDEFGVYEDMSVAEYLEFFAALYEVPPGERRRVIGDVLDLTDLAAKVDAPVEGLSRGMRQRLALARVLLHDPKVLLLDEPASGLDPRARIEVRELLRELRSMGKTILISSHILSELRELCTKVGIIERGRLLFSGSIAECLAQVRTERTYQLRLREGADRAQALLSEHELVRRATVLGQEGWVEVQLADAAEDCCFLSRLLVERGFGLLALREQEIDLEQAFLKVTKGQVA